MIRPVGLACAAALLLTACTASATTTTTLPPTTTGTTSGLTTTTTTTTTATTTSRVTTTTTTTTTPPVTWALALGDFGGGSSAEYAVADAMHRQAEDHQVTALVTTGDNFYTNDVEKIWTIPFGWVDDLGITVAAAWGNHDLTSSKRARLVQETLQPPGRWYATTVGPATLLVLDGNQSRSAAQRDWLETELAAAGNGPLVVVVHQPPFSCSLHGSNRHLIDSWVPLFERYGVDLVLSGHDHVYERFEVHGITYIVTGGGGRGIYRMKSCPRGTPAPVAKARVHHFLVLGITPTEITVTALTPDGKVVDRVTVPAS